MTIGTLILVGKKNSLLVKFTNAKGNQVQISIKDSELSLALTKKKQSNITELNGLEVEIEEVEGQPQKVREKGKPWEPPSSPSNSAKKQITTRTNTSPSPSSSSLNQATVSTDTARIANNLATPRGDFHNPYNFVSAPPRNTEQVQKTELKDDNPVAHGSYLQDRWSGKISVTLTTITPLLIPDAANLKEDKNHHKTYTIRVGSNGKPYLPPTSIKGMLRSAYEAVTNSRFSIFEKHEDRLAYRMPTTTGLQMVPARIENNRIHLYPGTSQIGNDGKPQGPMYAAWLPRYKLNSDQIDKVKAIEYIGSNTLPEHGQLVTAWLEKYKKIGKKGTIFEYWRVRKLVSKGQNIAMEPGEGQSYGSHHPTGDRIIQVNGYVCITNKNLDKKHDERVFFSLEEQFIKSVPLTNDIKKQWTELITNYQEIHKDEICDQHKKSPPALTNSVWSRHIKGEGNSLATCERKLRNGTLCYAQVRKNGNVYEVQGLYPVMIARALFEKNPKSLLSEELSSAQCIEELSPADRVFGWVKQGGKGSNNAYKGNLRIGTVTCQSDDPIKPFGDDGFPLAILGQPKPQQTRFYIAKDKQGNPLENRSFKESGYQNINNGLRGRKVYPHHKGLPEDYWNDPTQDKTQANNQGHFQEYRRPDFKKDGQDQTRNDQNRSIKAWVKPRVYFNLNIDITNLSNVELGALLWLLTLPEDHYHRLGGGKPLGFGSVHLAINWTETDLMKGEGWREFYFSLFSVNQPNPQEAEKCIGLFKKAVSEAYGNGQSFEQVSFIAAFCRSAKGFDDGLPIHYPRARKPGQSDPVPPHREGEAFEWFVANERSGNQYSLPSLVSDNGLPMLDAESDKK